MGKQLIPWLNENFFNKLGQVYGGLMITVTLLPWDGRWLIIACSFLSSHASQIFCPFSLSSSFSYWYVLSCPFFHSLSFISTKLHFLLKYIKCVFLSFLTLSTLPQVSVSWQFSQRIQVQRERWVRRKQGGEGELVYFGALHLHVSCNRALRVPVQLQLLVLVGFCS